MSKNVDLNKSSGVNHARLTIDIDGLGHTVVFRTGGITESPVAMSTTAGGGLKAEGLYDPWLVEGEVTVSKNMAQWLLQAYQKRSKAEKSSGVYELHSTTDNVIIKHQFDNVCVSKLPSINIDSLGAEVTMPVSFSLNDYISTEVING